MVQEEGREQQARSTRMNAVYDAIERTNSPDFFIGIETAGGPATPPPGAKLRNALQRWLGTLNHAAVSRLLDQGGLEALPRYNFEHDGWSVRFFPIPKGPKYRGREGVRAIGSTEYEAVWGDNREQILSSLEGKARRYGDLPEPYVIAVNVMGWAADGIEVVDALFGERVFTVSMGADGEPRAPVPSRRANGLWRSAGGPRYTRVSAVLVSYGLDEWQVARRTIHLYRNPWARRPCTGEILRLHRREVVAETLKTVEGVEPRELLGLSETWPETE